MRSLQCFIIKREKVNIFTEAVLKIKPASAVPPVRKKDRPDSIAKNSSRNSCCEGVNMAELDTTPHL